MLRHRGPVARVPRPRGDASEPPRDARELSQHRGRAVPARVVHGGGGGGRGTKRAKRVPRRRLDPARALPGLERRGRARGRSPRRGDRGTSRRRSRDGRRRNLRVGTPRSSRRRSSGGALSFAAGPSSRVRVARRRGLGIRRRRRAHEYRRSRARRADARVDGVGRGRDARARALGATLRDGAHSLVDFETHVVRVAPSGATAARIDPRAALVPPAPPPRRRSRACCG